MHSVKREENWFLNIIFLVNVELHWKKLTAKLDFGTFMKIFNLHYLEVVAFLKIQSRLLMHSSLVSVSESVSVSLPRLYLFQYLISNYDHKKSNRRNKPNLTKTKVDSVFTITYTNVRGLWSNFPVVELCLHEVRDGPSCSCLKLTSAIRVAGIHNPELLALKSPRPRTRRLYKETSSPMAKTLKNEEPDFLFLFFHVTFVHSASFMMMELLWSTK